jgi:hypothetical protein
MPLDFREVEAGSMIDEFHFDMWCGFLKFMLDQKEALAAFEAETGATMPRSPSNGLEIAIDKACGYDREAGQLDYIAKFAAWVTPLYWGGPEDICPAIAAKLAKAAA